MPTDSVNFSIVIAAVLVSWVLTELIRRNAARLGLVQSVNPRSSHFAPTPSGGGAAIALTGVLSGLILVPTAGLYLAVAVSVSLVAAAMGLLDDRFETPSRIRLVLQFIIAAVLMASVGDLPHLITPVGVVPSIIIGVTGTVAIVWWVNLFNFMDGIDGLAASELIYLVAALVALLLLNQETLTAIHWWLLVIGGATLGFLILNWPPAKIFMGDAGSNFLAVATGSAALYCVARGEVAGVTLLILSALFIVDATTTLVRRALAGERWFAAHKLHAYQKMSRRWGSHRKVTSFYLLINIVWLFPLAYLAETNANLSLAIAALAYAPVLWLCISSGAGVPERAMKDQQS